MLTVSHAVRSELEPVKKPVSVRLSLLVLNRLSQQCSGDANVMEVRSDESVLITDTTVKRREYM